jgi:secreted trypsin-like serine protease
MIYWNSVILLSIFLHAFDLFVCLHDKLGDGGAPIAFVDENILYQTGVVSYGEGCARLPNQASQVYTYTHKFHGMTKDMSS